MDWFFVAIGGAAGAVCRYAVSILPVRSAFPILTLLVNLLGAIIIGMVAGLSDSSPASPSWLSPLVKTGFCGGFTTFSTFSLEALKLWSGHRYALALLYAGLSVGLCCVGVWAGQLLVRRLRHG